MHDFSDLEMLNPGGHVSDMSTKISMHAVYSHHVLKWGLHSANNTISTNWDCESVVQFGAGVVCLLEVLIISKIGTN